MPCLQTAHGIMRFSPLVCTVQGAAKNVPSMPARARSHFEHLASFCMVQSYRVVPVSGSNASSAQSALAAKAVCWSCQQHCSRPMLALWCRDLALRSLEQQVTCPNSLQLAGDESAPTVRTRTKVCGWPQGC